MSSDRFDDNQNLPPWLRDVPLPPKPPGAEAPPTPEQPRAASPTSPAAPELPAWLRDEAPAAMPGASTEPGALPDWLRDIQSEQRADTPAPPPPAPRPRAESEQTMPGWLREIAGQSAPSSPRAPDEPAERDEAHLPDWLRDTAPAETPANQEALPAWLSDIIGPGDTPAAPDAPGAPEQTAAPEGLPSWLGDMTAAPEQSTAPSQSAAESPSWLQDLGVPEPRPRSEQGEQPDWLREQPVAAQPLGEDTDRGPSQPPPEDTLQPPGWPQDQAEAGAAAGESTPALPPEPPQTEPGIPSWLLDASPAADQEIAGEPFTYEGPPAERASPAQPDLPAWLVGDRAGEPPSETFPSWLQETAGAGPEPASAAPEVPLWLQDLERDGVAQPSAEAAPEPPAQPAPEPGEVGSQVELPSWLQTGASPGIPAVGAPAQHEDAGAAPPPSSDVPTWLREEPPAPPETEDMPPWLRDMRPGEPQIAQASDESLPAWLRDTAAESASAAPEAPPSAPLAEDVPAWLRDTAAESASAAPEAPPAEDMPAWLREVAPAEPAAADPRAPSEDARAGDRGQDAGVPPAPPADDDLPEWLRSSAPAAQPLAPADEVPPWLRDESGQPLPTADAPGEAGLPAWLRGAPIGAPAPSPQQPPEPQPAPSLDWFAGESGQPATPATDAGGLVGGIELPAWLRPTEPEPAKEEISPADARSLDWLSRLGGQEEEEGVAAATAPALKLTPPKPRARTPAQVEALALLQQLAADPFPEAAAAPAAAPASLWRRIGGERLLYLALLAAVVIALIMPAPAELRLAAPPAAPGAQELFGRIDRLGENDIVLVGYEWDARRSGELRPLEQAVMDHLIQRRVKLVLVSTDPQGSLLLFDLRDRLAAAGYRGAGQDYILLGYKPGAELALRSLAQDFVAGLRSDFQGNDASLGALAIDVATGKPRLQALGDLSMILVLADSMSNVQGWMEQVRPSARRADGQYVPFGLLLPAEVAPIAQPYLSPPIYYLAGKQGALAYQQLRGGSGMPIERIAAETEQQRLSALAYVGLFLIGAVVVAAAGLAARRRA